MDVIPPKKKRGKKTKPKTVSVLVGDIVVRFD
jgi:hypothetical protein